ncbi:mitochondrial outer membrane protein porin 2-like isoform X1 [Populus alba x Populus x berolinensis]|uniref:Mitochondrial outer membrane protein porin 2-like n=3 Tax=Populus TaxID=3689 RepID=A0A4U5QCI9_POPAL|nr:mitochondrial outer membrane protein porin 2-like isoform X1 [Populus alba]KAG6736703.1 hypothetical protein POTOM_060410 [Populus tomentosa]KAJ6965024.1 mitochondrial outer membrane protein porin 2-like isoform X1 [Populus alba x Populus x berolinensis]KAJ7013369.1 mitochondrial outer membrane protein porin 2-like isoform X1 [Populus alba x Populus x berolinensis]TKS08180.1 hypothetical protein D5086_0000108300 [Populus alba]
MSNSKHRKRRKRSAGSSKTSKAPQAPLLFSNFGKKPLDLVEAGYSKDHKFSISTCSTTGAKLTSSAVKRGQLSTASVAAQYKYKDATINVIVDSKSPISTTLTLSRKFPPSLNISVSLKFPKYDSSMISTTLTLSRKFLPSLNTSASLKLPKYDSSTLQAQYFHKYAALATSFSLHHTPKIQLSASAGTSTLAFGIQTKYEIASRQFREIDAGFSMTKPNYDASITMGNKGDFLRASYIHYFDHKKKVAAAAVISRRFSKKENALTVGGSWIMDNITTVKARVDDRGKIMMLLKYGIKSKSCLTIASEFDTKSLNKIPGIGLAFSLVL